MIFAIAFESMDEILQSDQLHETSSAILPCGTACYVVRHDQF